MMKDDIEKKYVVLDVETNGLNSTECDLLSISIYDPDRNKTYDRFLPLELNSFVFTTDINGITEEMLEDKKPIEQDEFNDLIKEFNLYGKTILTYGNIDKNFIKAYCKRHKLMGFDRLNFYNFKHQIISSGFSSGNVTKDNLCKIYNIDNVQSIHSGHNDCLLEWELFKKIYKKFLLVTGNTVYELNEKYMIPVSYLQTYNNFKYYRDIPKVYIKTKNIKKFELNKRKITRFETNISGISIEHLINTMLDVEKINSLEFEIKNKRNLIYIGKLPLIFNEIPVFLNKDGTIKSLDKDYDKYIESVNKTIKQIQKQLEPLIEYIRTIIFKNQKIYSQELIVDERTNVFSKCDLSNENAVLEIKTNHHLDFEKIKLQLFYESKNRPTYVLYLDWSKLEFIIIKVDFIDEFGFYDNKRKEKIQKSTKLFNQKIPNKDLIVLEYINSSCPVHLKCNNCNHEWSSNYKKILKNPVCPICSPNKVVSSIEKKIMAKEKLKIDYGKSFSEKVFAKSQGTIVVLKYYGSKSNAELGCLECNYIWKMRADYVIDRCYCPNCKKNIF